MRCVACGLCAEVCPAGAAEVVEVRGRRQAEINPALCKGCGLCVAACTKGALELDEGRVNVLGYHPVRLTDPTACTSCAICARVCPDAAFTVYAPPKGGDR